MLAASCAGLAVRESSAVSYNARHSYDSPFTGAVSTPSCIASNVHQSGGTVTLVTRVNSALYMYNLYHLYNLYSH